MNRYLPAALVALASLLPAASSAQDNPDKAFDNQLQQQRDAANQRLTDNNAGLYSNNPKDKKKVDAQKKADMQEYKGLVKDNLAGIKELFQRAEAAWKAKSYREAGLYYQSVAQATVPGSEDMVETSNTRINSDMENLAKDHLRNANDAGLQHDFMKEIDELAVIVKDLSITKTAKDAQRNLTTLKTKPEVAGYLEYSQAEQMLADNKLTEAMTALNSIVTNSRYEHTIPALKAARKLDELNKSEDTRLRVKTEFASRAQKEAPQLLIAAKNYSANNMPKKAIEKLELVIDKYPGTEYEEQAKKQLAELK